MYFKRLIQIPRLPDVRAQSDGARWNDFIINPLLPITNAESFAILIFPMKIWILIIANFARMW